MNLDFISLVSKNDYFFLVDNNNCRPVMLSKKAYEVINSLKSGSTLESLNEEYGTRTVTEILSGFDSLQSRKIVSKEQLNPYEEAADIIDSLASKELSIMDSIFMVSQSCNMACKYCYGGECGQFNKRGLMPKEMAERYFHYLLQNGGDRPFQKISFLGGEPLLNIDVISYVVELWEKWRPKYPNKKVYFSLTTNGTLLNGDIIRFLKEKEIGITVSVDGPKDMHDSNRVFPNGKGTFDRVMKGIDLLKEHAMPFAVRATITKNTDPDKLFSFLKSMNFNVTYITPVDFPVLEASKEYQLDLESFRNFAQKQQMLIEDGCRNVMSGEDNTFQAKQMSMAFHHLASFQKRFPFKCGAGWWIAAFALDGNIYPCQRFVGNESYCIGNINEGIQIERVKDFYNKFLEASKSCDSCWAVSLCRRRCFNQKATGDGGFEQIPEAICDIYRDNYALSLIFSTRLQSCAEKNKNGLDKALIRYDADHMMKNHDMVRNGFI